MFVDVGFRQLLLGVEVGREGRADDGWLQRRDRKVVAIRAGAGAHHQRKQTKDVVERREQPPEIRTGLIEIVRYLVVDDFGTVINPLLLAGQVNGGIAQGVGQAMLERTVYDAESGQLLTGNLTDYAIPHADTLPALEFSYNVVPCRTNPLGVKGAGEAGAIGAPPALINAVLDAVAELGIETLDMPLIPERLWRALRDAQNAKAA